MRHFLARLLMKSQGAPGAVRPRLPSRFDPAPLAPLEPGSPLEIDAEHEASISRPMLRTSSTGTTLSSYEAQSPERPAMPASRPGEPAQAVELGQTSEPPRNATSPRPIDEPPETVTAPGRPAPPLLPFESPQTRSSPPAPSVPRKLESSATADLTAESTESHADAPGPVEHSTSLSSVPPFVPSQEPLPDLEQEVEVEPGSKRTVAPAVGPAPSRPAPSQPAPSQAAPFQSAPSQPAPFQSASRERIALAPIVGRIAAANGQEPAPQRHTARGVPGALPGEVRARALSAAANHGLPARSQSRATRALPGESPEPGPETVVHVAIGRIEVRLAPAPASPGARTKPTSPDGVMSLTDYLQERERGGRR
jgi:hypothetical protein